MAAAAPTHPQPAATAEKSESEARRCDLCRDKPVKAAVCCSDCEKCYCEQHGQEHSHISNHKLQPVKADLSNVNKGRDEDKAETKTATSVTGEAEKKTKCDSCSTALTSKEDGSYYQFCPACGKDCTVGDTGNKRDDHKPVIMVVERYEVERCPAHIKHVLDEICVTCKTKFCRRCDTKGKCSAQNRDSHHAAGLVEQAGAGGTAEEKTAEEKTAAETKICEECEAPRAKTRQGVHAKFCFECGHNFSDKTPAQAQASRGEHHEVIPLRKFTDDMRDRLRILSQGIYDKIKRCRSSVKSSWKRLSDLEDHVKSINHIIDIMADDLIRQIRHESEELKREIREHIDRSTDEVEQFSDETLLNTTVLDDLYIFGTHLADRGTDRQLLEEFDEVARELEQTISNKDYEKVMVLTKPYLHTGTHTLKINAKLEFPPTSIDHVKTENTAQACYGVSSTDDDNIVGFHTVIEKL